MDQQHGSGGKKPQQGLGFFCGMQDTLTMNSSGGNTENAVPPEGIFESQGSFDRMQTQGAEEAARRAIAEGRAARHDELAQATEAWGVPPQPDPPSSEAENRQVLAALGGEEDGNRFSQAIQMAHELQRAADYELAFHDSSAAPRGQEHD